MFACLSICRMGAGSRAEGDGFKEWECASDGTRCISGPLVGRLTRRPKHIVLPCATVLERFNAEKKGCGAVLGIGIYLNCPKISGHPKCANANLESQASNPKFANANLGFEASKS